MPGTGIENIFSPQIQIFEPFGAHVDPSRTNMSSKQILQLVTSRMNEVPFMLRHIEILLKLNLHIFLEHNMMGSL